MGAGGSLLSRMAMADESVLTVVRVRVGSLPGMLHTTCHLATSPPLHLSTSHCCHCRRSLRHCSSRRRSSRSASSVSKSRSSRATSRTFAAQGTATMRGCSSAAAWGTGVHRPAGCSGHNTGATRQRAAQQPAAPCSGQPAARSRQTAAGQQQASSRPAAGQQQASSRAPTDCSSSSTTSSRSSSAPNDMLPVAPVVPPPAGAASRHRRERRGRQGLGPRLRNGARPLRIPTWQRRALRCQVADGGPAQQHAQRSDRLRVASAAAHRPSALLSSGPPTSAASRLRPRVQGTGARSQGSHPPWTAAWGGRRPGPLPQSRQTSGRRTRTR
jgi:hypothetical protein